MLSICPKCKRDFRTFIGLYNHLISKHPDLEIEIVHKGINKFKCDKCDRKFLNKTLLNQHKRTKLYLERDCKPIVHKCNQCSKQFISSKALYSHKNSLFYKNGCKQISHSYNCNQCSKIFKSKRDLNRHINSKFYGRGCKKISYSCTPCNKSFRSKYDLNKHLKTKIHQS